jgi:hypothetical protein
MFFATPRTFQARSKEGVNSGVHILMGVIVIEIHLSLSAWV